MNKKKYRNEMSATQDYTYVKNKIANRQRTSKKIFTGTFTYAMTILLISFILSIFVIKVANDALAFSKPDSIVEVEISKGASTSEIAETLKDAGVIKYKFAFVLFTKMTHNDGKFKYGKYELNTKMDYLGIITALKKNSTLRDTVRVLIPEGKEQREIIKILVDNGVCTEKELLDTINNHKFDYEFLKNLPKRENYLEGYLFPDTYEFFKNDDPVAVIKKMLDNFDKKFDNSLREKAKKAGMTIDEVVTLASIIEREAAGEEDRGKVASVFTNRLKANSQYPYLQSCATVQYILKERKSILTIEDTKIDSPYNT